MLLNTFLIIYSDFMLIIFIYYQKKPFKLFLVLKLSIIIIASIIYIIKFIEHCFHLIYPAARLWRLLSLNGHFYLFWQFSI